MVKIGLTCHQRGNPPPPPEKKEVETSVVFLQDATFRLGSPLALPVLAPCRPTAVGSLPAEILPNEDPEICIYDVSLRTKSQASKTIPGVLFISKAAKPKRAFSCVQLVWRSNRIGEGVD